MVSPAGEELREQALQHARLTVECQSSYAASHAFLGKTLVRLYLASDRERMKEARAAFARACQLHPYRPEYFYLLGETEARLGNQATAEKLWQITLALDRNPKLSDARAHLDEESRADLKARLGIIVKDNLK